MEWKECQTSIYEELKSMHKKMDVLNTQITELRIEQAVHREKINEGRKFQSSVWGVIGGAVSAALLAIIDIIFNKK